MLQLTNSLPRNISPNEVKYNKVLWCLLPYLSKGSNAACLTDFLSQASERRDLKFFPLLRERLRTTCAAAHTQRLVSRGSDRGGLLPVKLMSLSSSAQPPDRCQVCVCSPVSPYIQCPPSSSLPLSLPLPRCCRGCCRPGALTSPAAPAPDSPGVCPCSSAAAAAAVASYMSLSRCCIEQHDDQIVLLRESTGRESVQRHCSLARRRRRSSDGSDCSDGLTHRVDTFLCRCRSSPFSHFVPVQPGPTAPPSRSCASCALLSSSRLSSAASVESQAPGPGTRSAQGAPQSCVSVPSGFLLKHTC